MFEAKITKAKLEEALAVPDALVEEAILVFTDEGLNITVVDPANVAMGMADIPASDFAMYKTDGATLGIFTEKLFNVLGMMDGQDELAMTLDEETRKLELATNGLVYTIALIDPNSIDTMDELPDIPFGAKITFETPALKRVVKAADMVSDHLTLRVKDGAFSIDASGDDDGIDYDATDANLSPGVDGTVEDLESMFSLSYLKEMCKAIDGEYVAASVADSMPVRIEFKFAESDGTGVFFIAPRVSSQ